MTNIGSAFNTRSLSDAALGSPGDRDLGLTIFSGQVLEAFYQKSVFYDNQGSFMTKKVLDGGIAAQWPVIGEDFALHDIGVNDANSDGEIAAGEISSSGGLKLGFHQVGEFIQGQQVKMTAKTVTVDDMLVAAIDVPFIDMDLSHFDVLGPFATKLGRILARDLDRRLAAVALKAANTSAVTGVHPGGNKVHFVPASPSGKDTVAECYPTTTAALTMTSANEFREHVGQLALDLDRDFVPEDGRYLFITPYIRHLLRGLGSEFVQNVSMGNPYNNQTAGSYTGDRSQRELLQLEGFNLIVTDSMPGDWLVSTGGRYNSLLGADGAQYDFDCDGANATKGVPAAIALCGAREGSAAIGMVQAGGMRSIIEDDERRNQKFMKSQLLVGADVLSPWCAGAITCGAS
jgi:hypothetical protein